MVGHETIHYIKVKIQSDILDVGLGCAKTNIEKCVLLTKVKTLKKSK